MRIPLLGGFLARIIAYRVSQLLGLLLRSGAPILVSLRVTAEATGFYSMKSEILAVAKAVERGESLAQAMGGVRRFPSLGEHTEEVLADMGIDADRLAALRDKGAIA